MECPNVARDGVWLVPATRPSLKRERFVGLGKSAFKQRVTTRIERREVGSMEKEANVQKPSRAKTEDDVPVIAAIAGSD